MEKGRVERSMGERKAGRLKERLGGRGEEI